MQTGQRAADATLQHTPALYATHSSAEEQDAVSSQNGNFDRHALSHSESTSAPRRGGSQKSNDASSPSTLAATKSPSWSVQKPEQSTNSENDSFPWKPSILRIGPLMGLAALAFAFLQTFAAYAVLKASEPTASWKCTYLYI